MDQRKDKKWIDQACVAATIVASVLVLTVVMVIADRSNEREFAAIHQEFVSTNQSVVNMKDSQATANAQILEKLNDIRATLAKREAASP